MNESLLNDLQKKDSDLVLIAQDENSFIIKTHLNIGTEIKEEEEVKFDNPPAIPIRIVRQTFVINAFIFFFIVFFGISPFYLLFQQVFIAQVLLAGSFAIGILLFVCMYFCMKVEFLLIWLFCLYTSISTICVVLQSLAPLQICLIFFIQYITILIYCLYSKKKVNPQNSIILTMGIGMIVWGINLYGFVKENDWVAAGVLFFVGVMLNPLYIAYEIFQFNKGRVNNDELGKSLLFFYTDPVCLWFGFCIRPKKKEEEVKEIELEDFELIKK